MLMNPTSTSWKEHRTLALAQLLFLSALGIFVFGVGSNFYSITRSSKRMTRTYEIDGRIADLRVKTSESCLSLNRFLLSGDQKDQTEFNHAVEGVKETIHNLNQVVGGDPYRWELLNKIQLALDPLFRAQEDSARKRASIRDLGKELVTSSYEVQRLADVVQERVADLSNHLVKTRNELRAIRDEFYLHSVIAFVTAFSLVFLLLLALQFFDYRAKKKLQLNAEWLGTTLRSIGDAVIATDPEGRITFMNGIAEGLTGWNESEAKGQSLEKVFQIINETTREIATTPVSRALMTGAIQGLANHTILISRNSTERPIDDSAAPIRDPNGRIHGCVMVFRDVTGEKVAQSERERLYRELTIRDKRKDEFLAMLAHELRNPLAAIGNALMLSSTDELREHREWAQDVIRRQMTHLSRLIDDLLDVSRISRGKIELKLSHVDAAAILANSIEAVHGLIDEKQHTLNVRIEPASLWTEADPTRLEQVLVNILVNAAKYTDRGGRIDVTGELEGDFVIITIKDTGVGIPPEKLPEMFELFAQGDRSLARSEGGLGIGLTLVKRLVEMHGGSITARSEGAGLGTEFVVKLPAFAAPIHPVTSRIDMNKEPLVSRILVVDDNVDTVYGLARILTLLGHRVSTACSGPEALETAKNDRPDFILLDIGLPGMDGFEVARRLRSEDFAREAVIIAITGYGQQEDRHRTQESGFDHHLVKPLDHGTLISILARHRTTSSPN